jgi:uncharacterized protein YjbI with pentapeptide repeats
VFESVVHIDASGTAARRRASLDELMAAPPPTPQLVEKLIYPGRLLLAENIDGQATVTLMHEALLQEWAALRDWLGADYLNLLKEGVDAWNAWRAKEPSIRPNLSRADLSGANLRGADLHGAKLNGANLSKADLQETNLREASLKGADLQEANLSRADLSRADLEFAILIDTDLTEADLRGCRVYGVSAWRTKLDRVLQENLIISEFSDPQITVDNIEVVQFANLLLHREKLGVVIDAVTAKVVLLLGRLTRERKAVLDALVEALRRRNYIPILFDFEKPASRSFSETIMLLASLARFVIADITDAKSVFQELEAVVPRSPRLPVQPIISADQPEPLMFDFIASYPWVLKTYCYDNLAQLIANLDERVIRPAEAKAVEVRGPQP